MFDVSKMVRMIKAKTDFHTYAAIGDAAGVSKQAIHNMTKTNKVKVETLMLIANACDVSLSELISWGE